MNWYGALIGIGMLVCVVWAYFIAKKRGYYKDMVFDMAFVGILFGIFGARLYYVLFNLDQFPTFGSFFGFHPTRGFTGLAGLAIFGGIIGALLGGVMLHFREHIAHGFKVLWSKISGTPKPPFKRKPEKEKATFLQMADLALMFMILGQAIGRWGNFTNQELYGSPTTWHFFPLTVRIDASSHYAHLALFFYESMWNLVGFGVLYFLYQGRRKSFDGFILSVYLIWYGTGRVVLEPLRMDQFRMGANSVLNIVVAALAIVVGLVIIIHHLYKARTKGMKPFIFVDQGMLTEKYLNYRQSILHHPNIYEPKAKRAANLDDEFYAEADDGFSQEDAEEFYNKADENKKTEEILEKKVETSIEDASLDPPAQEEQKKETKQKPVEEEGFTQEDAEEFFKNSKQDDDGFYSTD
ncbi:MAG: prolipoprotein diacylglyceryl transferase [Firmicutes bacterium]|nr:prolipoprotein diacylglyceryl transferase [Bacillota bacterium]